MLNVNNPWARNQLWPEKLIVELPRDRFEPLFKEMLPKFKPPYHCAVSVDGEHLLGVVQRIETFDFVVNTDVISRRHGREGGLGPVLQPGLRPALRHPRL